MRSARRRPTPGFTLIELAIVLAVAAVLLGLGVPGLSRGVASHALPAQAAEFMSALRLARSQALARGAVVTVCAVDADAPSATPRCQPPAAAHPDWRAGWLVFVDRGARGVRDADDPVLRFQQPLARSGGVSGTRASLSFTAAGFAADAASHYRFDPVRTFGAEPPPSVLVCVSKQGRPRIAGAGGCR